MLECSDKGLICPRCKATIPRFHLNALNIGTDGSIRCQNASCRASLTVEQVMPISYRRQLEPHKISNKR